MGPQSFKEIRKIIIIKYIIKKYNEIKIGGKQVNVIFKYVFD